MPKRTPASHAPTVRFGVDRVVDDPSLLSPHVRVGLVTNEAARLAGDASRPSREALLAAGVPVVRLFSPEHGLSARGDDGAAMGDGTDPLTGLPVISLYGERFAPPDETLADLDAVLFDIPDVGARFYTYGWTLSHVLESCARTGTPLVVLDRPNPLGGRLAAAEGPLLDEAHCASFVGRWSIPIRHSLTLGELARHWSTTRVAGATARVVACGGWRRDMLWPALGLPWVSTSPAMPAFESALLYPGLCLFEGTNLSVGRGTNAPFRQVAAPWLDPAAVLHALREGPWSAPDDGASPFAGARFHAGVVTPAQHPYAGEVCQALCVEVTDMSQVRPVALALALLAAILRAHRQDFEWTRYPTAANPAGGDHFARLAGDATLGARLSDPATPVTPADIAHWTSAGAWAQQVQQALVYP